MRAAVLYFIAFSICAFPMAAQAQSDCSDAEVIALEYYGTLEPVPEYRDAIAQDLAVIRADFPDLDDIHAREWAAFGQILVELTDAAWAEWVAGTFTAIEERNAYYGAIQIHQVVTYPLLWIDFGRCLYPPALADDYETIDGVLYAAPNATLGDGSDITMLEPGRYLFDRGWGDCLVGCMYHITWEIEVSNGVSTLLAVRPTPSPNVPPIDGLTLEDPRPNPFNPNTVLRFHVVEPGWVDLRVVDLRGRTVRKLEGRFRAPGLYEARWNGRNDSGETVASGVYVGVLRQGDQVSTRKMVLVQ